MIRRRSGRSVDGRAEAHELLATLWRESSYDARLDSVLVAVKELAGTLDAYLYLADESGRRLHLERSRARPAADPTRVPPGETARVVEGGAEWIAPTPPLELARGDEDDSPRVVRTTVGRMYSLPLLHEGELTGVAQAGPVGEERVPSAVHARFEELRFALALVVRHARRDESLRRELATTTARFEASRRLAGSALDLDRFVRLLLELALKSTSTEAGFVAISDPSSGGLAVSAESGMPAGFAAAVDLSPETGLFDWTLGEQTGALVLRDFETASRLGIRSLLAVPLVEDGDSLGVFSLVNFGEGGTFDDQSLTLLETFAEQIRLMLHNARLFHSFADRYIETVIGLARALDARRPQTEDHHERVACVADAVAAELGLAAPVREAVHTAALLHDVGMAGMAEIEGGFDADVEHPTVGASLIEHLPLHPAVSGSVAGHHEWYDGWGFPKGLKGSEIPLGALILGVAEFVVELSTSDAVRAAWPPERLAEEIEERRGSQFEPFVADVAARLVRARRIGFGATRAPEDEED